VHDKEDAMNRSLPIVVALALLGCAGARTKPVAACTQQQASQQDSVDYAPIDVTRTYGPSQVIWFRPPAQPNNNCI
jgi:outer membrane lipoprotein SlyB